jgi:murein DD-endopeptidase
MKTTQLAILSACAMLIAWPTPSGLSAQTRMSAPRFALRVPNAPTVANGETGAFLVYELHLTNTVAQQWTVRKVEVLSGTPNPHVLQTLESRELEQAIVRPGTTIPAAERTIFAGGAWGVLMMWVPVDRAAPPASLSHRVTFALDNTAGAAVRDLQGGEAAVRRETVMIGPPLSGGPWRVANITNASAHRRGMFGYGGEPTINARFAIDYLKMGDDDRPFTGERTRHENWHGYGQEVLAVADGRVAAISDGIADNTFAGPSGPPDLDTIRGNHILLEIGPRLYATYAHLKPGSVRVAVGQRVTRGQVIGLVGSTGASSAPHLHFQLSEAPDVISDGVPYAHRAFDVVGRCQQTGPAPWDQTCTHVPPEVHRGEMPLNGMLVRFHEGRRTPEGRPDLQGVWRVHTITPLERPAEFADKPFLTPREASAYQARRLAALNLDTSPERAGLNGPSVNEFWAADRGELAVLAGRVPTSLVVDPPDGRIPPPTSARRAKLAARLEVRRQAASAAAFNTSERCLRDGGAPLFGSADRGLIEIIQTNTHVVIRQENLHDTRVIPLDGRPHVASSIRSWTGDPRGSWSNDVLIVHSTNFTDLGDRFDENLHLVERFSRIDSETLLYEFTVDDPTVYTRPWSVVWPLKRSAGPLFEEACHEGNYSLPAMLRAVRLQEATR